MQSFLLFYVSEDLFLFSTALGLLRNGSSSTQKNSWLPLLLLNCLSLLLQLLRHSTFDSLRLGRTTQFIVGRLLRFWDSRNIKKGGEFIGITD
ncbi:hypothetical protein YC2023_083122 [Brassica napus]